MGLPRRTGSTAHGSPSQQFQHIISRCRCPPDRHHLDGGPAMWTATVRLPAGAAGQRRRLGAGLQGRGPVLCGLHPQGAATRRPIRSQPGGTASTAPTPPAPPDRGQQHPPPIPHQDAGFVVSYTVPDAGGGAVTAGVDEPGRNGDRGPFGPGEPVQITGGTSCRSSNRTVKITACGRGTDYPPRWADLHQRRSTAARRHAGGSSRVEEAIHGGHSIGRALAAPTHAGRLPTTPWWGAGVAGWPLPTSRPARETSSCQQGPSGLAFACWVAGSGGGSGVPVRVFREVQCGEFCQAEDSGKGQARRQRSGSGGTNA